MELVMQWLYESSGATVNQTWTKLSFFIFYLIFFSHSESLLLHAWALPLVAESRGHSLVAEYGLLIAVVFLVEKHGALGHVGFSSCSTWAR